MFGFFTKLNNITEFLLQKRLLPMKPVLLYLLLYLFTPISGMVYL